MNIIVVGCGKIGTAAISTLVTEGHDVTAIDNDSTVINDITDIYDIMGICGNGIDNEVLSDAGVAKTELFIACTDSDELNMLSCFIAKKMGAKHTVARIRNPEYNDQSSLVMRQYLDLSMAINPERLAARELLHMLKFPAAAKIETFSRRGLEMIEIRIPETSLLNGMKLINLRSKFKAQFLICAVHRGTEIFIPDGNFELKSGDRIGLTGTPSEIEKLLKSLGEKKKESKNIMILGGNTIGYYLAKMFSYSGVSIKIIESDYDRCQYLSSIIPNAIVIQGDGSQQELLLEEGLDSLDAFVALTGMDEQNILISILASMHKVPKIMCKISNDELLPLAEKMGIESIVSPTNATMNVIVGYARALENSMGSNVESMYKIMDGKAEALEFKVRSDSKLIGKSLKGLNFKKNILVAGIIRGKKIIIPSGDDVILADDRVVVIAANQRLNDLSDIVVK